MKVVLVSALLLFANLLLSGISLAHAETERYAIVVGNNSGATDEADLQYAVSDARKVRDTLVRLGRFAPQNVSLMAGNRAGEVRRTIISFNDRIRQRGQPAVLLVYYSGHADENALHLGDTELSIRELEELVRGSAAEVRMLILDSCRSGALTRVKGGRRVPARPVVISHRSAGSGVVFMTASAASEDAQESHRLKGSFFTHYLVSGLLGAADSNGDGQVALSEAYRHAYDGTLRASSRSQVGNQHPTFRYDFAGRVDVVLTEPGLNKSDHGWLRFPPAKSYLVMRDDADGPVVGEVGARDSQRRLALPKGRYFLRARARRHLLEGVVEVRDNAEVTIDNAKLSRSAYARLARKGGGLNVHSLEAGVNLRTALSNSDTMCTGVSLGHGWHTSDFDLATAANLCSATFASTFVDARLLEAGMTLELRKSFDLSERLSLAPAVGLGAGFFHQRFATEGEASPRSSSFAKVSASLGMRWLAHGALFVDGRGSLQTYVYRSEGSARADVALVSLIGLGMYL